MNAVPHSLAATNERGRVEFSLITWERSIPTLSCATIHDKPTIASIRRSAEEILRLCDAAGAAANQPEVKLAALGIALHADDVISFAWQLGGES
jgi:hypothetical protein